MLLFTASLFQHAAQLLFESYTSRKKIDLREQSGRRLWTQPQRCHVASLPQLLP